MIRSYTYAATLLISSASMAVAGGISEPVTTPAPVMVAPAPVVFSNDWTGAYVGGGFGVGEITSGEDDPIDTNDLSLLAGYMYDMGSMVVGGEIEYERFDFDDGGDSLDASVLRLKGRVGYDAGAFLPYLTVGAARLALEDGSDVADNGYFYGAGADYAVNENFRLGAEILQHEFDNFNDGGADVSARTMSFRASYSF